MRKRVCISIFVLLLTVLLGVSVYADSYKPGEVLYRQDFADVSGKPIYKAGIRKGTNSSPNSVLLLDDDMLQIVTKDDLRTYAILPEMPWTDSYTIEFTFRFEDVRSSRGFLAFLLTSWGEEPSNITSLIIRANGTVDDFGPLSDEIVGAIQSGEEMIHVEIPIENGVLHEVTLKAGKAECTVERESLRRITEGNRGFGVRNLTACVGEVYVVNGTGYTAKTGALKDMSWSEDPANAELTEAPPTGDPVWVFVCPGICAGSLLWAKRTKKHR